MNLNGQRQQKGKSSKEKIRELEVMMQNAQMATQISQMMLKQVLEQFQGLRSDVDNTMGILNDFQYRTQAMLSLGEFDVDALNKKATELKLTDYMKASDLEDATKGYELDDSGVVTEESVVIITSSTDGDADKGIFRSKFTFSECQTETLKEGLLGKKVGDKFTEVISDTSHEIEIVGLRKVIIKEAALEGSDGETNKSN